MAKLIFTLSESESLDFPLDAALSRMGRRPENDIVINNTWISGHHAEFRREGDVLILKDLDSSNGTSVNGERISEKALKDGDRISFGQLDAIYQADAVVKPAAAAPVAQILRPGVTLVPRPPAARPAAAAAAAVPASPVSPTAPATVAASPAKVEVPATPAPAPAPVQVHAPVVIARPMAPPAATIAYDQARKEMSAELEEIQQKTVKANADAAAARAAREAAQTELAQMKSALEEAKTQFAAWQATEETARATAAEKVKTDAAMLARRLEEETATARTVLSGLETAIAQKRQEQSAMDQAAVQRAAAWAEESQRAAAGVESAQAALAAVNAETTGARAALDNIRADLQSAQALLATRRGESDAAAAALNIQKQEAALVQQELEALRASRNHVRTELAAMEQELVAAQNAQAERRQEAEVFQQKSAADHAAAQAELARLKQEGAGILERHAALEAATARLTEEAAAWPAKRDAAAAELAGLQEAILTAREAASAEDRKMSARLKAVEQLERQHNVLASKLALWQEKESTAERHTVIIETIRKDLAEASTRHENLTQELTELAIQRSTLTSEIKTLESRLETIRRDTEGAEALNSKVADLRHQQAETERQLEFLNDRLSGMSEAPDPNWGTVHSLARSFIRKLDLMDDLIQHLEGRPESADALSQLNVFRSGLLDILKEYSIEAYSLEPGTVIDVAARKRIQIVETLSEGTHDGTRIVRTYRPGYVCQNGDLGIPTLLRKADVAVSISMS